MTTLATALEAVRDRIEAETSLVRSRSIETLRTLPDHLQSGSFAAWPGRSSNKGGPRASGSLVFVADEITIEIAQRLRTADEIASFDAALTTADGVRVALTAASWWASAGLTCVEWSTDSRQRAGGWVTITSTYRVTRQDVLG
jgi:hypothetical protein